MKIRVRAKPNSRQESIKQIENDYFEIKVTVPPEKGRANERIIEILAKHLKIPKSKIVLLKGETSRDKLLEIINH